MQHDHDLEEPPPGSALMLSEDIEACSGESPLIECAKNIGSDDFLEFAARLGAQNSRQHNLNLGVFFFFPDKRKSWEKRSYIDHLQKITL